MCPAAFLRSAAGNTAQERQTRFFQPGGILRAFFVAPAGRRNTVPWLTSH